MTEKKIIRIQDRDFDTLEKYFKEGWEVSKMSACGSGQCINTFLYVLLIRNKDYKEYKDMVCD